MCYIYSMLTSSARPIDQYQIPKMLSRFAAAVVDLALFILSSLLVLSIVGFFMSREGTDYNKNSTILNTQIKSSKLAKFEDNNGYVLYNNSDFLNLNEDHNRPEIIEHLSYFYLSYLTGENVDADLSASLDKDEKIRIDGIDYLPKEYYNVTYFNETVLSLPKPGEINHSPYFIYSKNGEENDYSKIGIIKDDYIEDVTSGDTTIKRLKNDSELIKYLNNIYQSSVELFFKQPSIVKTQDAMNKTNIFVLLISSVPMVLIFYYLLPLLSPFGQTLGKRFLSLAVVDDQGYQVKKWQLLLRGIPILGVTIFIGLINNLYFQFLVPVFFLLVSTGLLVFNARHRCLHDFMARTIVIKIDKKTVVYPDEEKYAQALEIIKQKEGLEHGEE